MDALDLDDPPWTLIAARMYWKGAMDPETSDYFHHAWVIQTWYCLLVWAEERS